MPAFEIDTNAAAEKITPDLVKDMTNLVAEMLGLEPKCLTVFPCGLQWLTVIFRPNPLMQWAGTSDLCAVCKLTAIKNVNEEANRGYTEKVFKFMGERLSIPGDRMYCVFFSPEPTHVGFTGKLFSDIMK